MTETKLNDTQTLLPTERQQEAQETLNFIEELAPTEQKSFLAFLQGVRFANSMRGRESRAAEAVLR